MATGATVPAAVRCLYVDLDGTLLGPNASLLTGADGRFSTRGVRALEACARADAEVVLFSGRKQSSVFEASRLIGTSAFIFELGAGLVIEGELEWLTGGMEPTADGVSIFDQITATGAPELLLERFAGRLEYHAPWAKQRDVSHLFRGEVDLDEAHAILQDAGLDGLRLVDNGVIARGSPTLQLAGVVRAYHLVPSASSKARAVARHQQARGYAPEDCIAVGDSREDMDAAAAVGAFWLVANALERDPGLAEEAAARPGVRIAEAGYGAGVYEAVVTTLSGG